MRNNLLEFLYGSAVIRESQHNLGEQIVKLFEEAADEEIEKMVATKEPLVVALKSLGISADVEALSQACELTCHDPEEYRRYARILSDPENMHALASKGWVPTKCGDVSMSFEPPEMKIGFIEIDTVETNDKDKVPDLEKVLKDAQKFAATEPEHDDEMNPVEFDDKTSDNHKKGVGDAKDGAAPEGKPKGSSKSESISCPKCKSGSVTHREKGTGTTGAKYTCNKCHHAWKAPITAKEVSDSLLDEMTSTAAVPAFEGPAPVMANQGPEWKKRLAALRKRRGDKPDDVRP